MIVSNIGVNPGFSALYSPNSATHTGFTQVALSPAHRTSSFVYIREVITALARQMPELQTFFSSGSLVDGVLNMGAPAPIDIRVAGNNMNADYDTAQKMATQLRSVKGVADVYIPQDLDYPSLRISIDRMRASELGLTEKEVVTNIITALTSNQMIAPSIWIDPNSGNNYFLTVMYKEDQIKSIEDLKAIPLHGTNLTQPTRLDMVANIQQFNAPTEMDRTQIRRVMDIYVLQNGKASAALLVTFRILWTMRTHPGDRGYARWQREFHERILSELCDWPHAFRPPPLPDPRRAVPFVSRSLYHPAGSSSGPYRCPDRAASLGNNTQRHVSYGNRYAGWHCALEQYPNCGVRTPPSERGNGRA